MNVQPSPYSPYATADPAERHLFPTLFGPPAAGALLPTGCHALAVAPDEPLKVDPAEELPAGVCAPCAAAMRDDTASAPRPVTTCYSCGDQTHHNRLCAVCRAEAHQMWAATRVAAEPPPSTDVGTLIVRGGPISISPNAFCEHGDLAFTARVHVRPLHGRQEDATLNLLLPRCYLAKMFGAVLAAVDEDPSPEAQDRFTQTVTETQAVVRDTLRSRRDENGPAT
ncbi:hypothetical protein ABZX77_40650 [Streptomyces sp. NPDC004237]|uniref:hypothetical protein n=1 Tax=Streptomyces sp. NPDC004237 TaxID=3154455 RepID=UPI0033B5C6C2